MTEGRLRIGSLAARTGCNIETIRYYERIGLLPKPPRSEGGYRLYEEEHVRRLNFVRRARSLGFHLADILELVQLQGDNHEICAEARKVAARHLAEVQSRISEMRAIETILAAAIQRCDDAAEPGCAIVETLSTTEPTESQGACCPAIKNNN